MLVKERREGIEEGGGQALKIC